MSPSGFLYHIGTENPNYNKEIHNFSHLAFWKLFITHSILSVDTFYSKPQFVCTLNTLGLSLLSHTAALLWVKWQYDRYRTRNDSLVSRQKSDDY